VSNQVTLWKKGPSKVITRIEWAVWTSGDRLEWHDHLQRSAMYVEIGDNKNGSRRYPSDAAALDAMQRAIAKKLTQGFQYRDEPPPPPQPKPSKAWPKGRAKPPRWLSKVDAKQLAALRKTIDAADLAHRRADIETLLRPAIHFKLKTVKSVKGVVTRFGGEPDVPGDFPWPRAGKINLAFVAQFRLDELAKLDLENKLPKKGLLSVFAQLVPEDGYGSNIAVYVFDDVKNLKRATSQHIVEGFPTKIATATASLKLTLPSPDEPTGLRLSSDERERYHDDVWLVSVAERDSPSGPGAHQLLGWPSGQLRGKGSELLVQIDSDDRCGLEMGDCEPLRIEISAAQLAKADFRKVRGAIGAQ
jgi:hypothetical protein